MMKDEEQQQPQRGEKKLVLLSDPSTTKTVAKASSVLNRNVKLYGPMHAIDGSNWDSCWNSDGVQDNDDDDDESSVIYFTLLFHRRVTIQSIKIQFQGGFVGSGRVFVDQTELDMDLDPDDSNALQTVDFTQDEPLEHHRQGQSMKFAFDSSTDFYGRVTIYRLEVWGYEAEP
jgi:hypothetical protein